MYEIKLELRKAGIFWERQNECVKLKNVTKSKHELVTFNKICEVKHARSEARLQNTKLKCLYSNKHVCKRYLENNAY